MKKIYISAGHTNKVGRDRGAVGNGFIEGDEMVKLRDLITTELNILGASTYTDKDNSILSETLKDFKNRVNENDIVIDLHLNAATPKATGVETLVPNPPTEDERKLAESLSKVVSDTLNIPMRGNKGVKTEAESQHKRLGFMRLAGTTVLLEVCFISNPNDMRVYKQKSPELAKAIAKLLVTHVKTPTKATSFKFYTVVSGDSLSRIAVKLSTTITKLKKDNSLNSDLIQVGQKLKY